MSFKRWLSSGSIDKEKPRDLFNLDSNKEASMIASITPSASSKIIEKAELTNIHDIAEGNENEETQVVENFKIPESDGSDKVFGLENFGNTCYCNSILQCLFYTDAFRQAIVKYPILENSSRKRKSSMPGSRPHITVQINESITNANAKEKEKENEKEKEKEKTESIDNRPRTTFIRRTSSFFGRKKDDENNNENNNDTINDNENTNDSNSSVNQTIITSSIPFMKPSKSDVIVGKLDDPNSTTDQRKRAALLKGPIVNVDHSFSDYGLEESLFTASKDLFESIIENDARTGVVSPSNLIDILKRENELFRSTMHQDAHEFLNFLLNQIIEVLNKLLNVEKNAIHDLFEGLLTNQTRCLTCENISTRDEFFLDLSVDLQDGVTIEKCLKQFSASEMLTGTNKFYCDNCHSLQEAEKKMGIRKLPKILALHLKRFEYSEELNRNIKLFAKIKYPLFLELESDYPTDLSEDGHKFYELYGVVIHIGGGPHHGHYVSFVKTESQGWLLFDDETVERIDESFVSRFIQDCPDLTTPYVLFYKETTQERFQDSKKKNVVSNLTNGIEKFRMSVDSVNKVPEIEESSPFDKVINSSINSLQLTAQSSSNSSESSQTKPINIKSDNKSAESITIFQKHTSFSSRSRSKPMSIKMPDVLNENSLSSYGNGMNSTPVSSSSISSFWSKKKIDSSFEPPKSGDQKKKRMSISFGFKKN
ncbi:hypothetical protein WICMUC_003558 [Wickerhamomyces mucosus]|uniref:Ubiquitin carboxyl-terminal hydrolase n=1 Tax=Wickerhamomyces mucosus TaxID=1378264 RepID=A0A9P8TCN9_9ASCO|nr:hypothetical protein WICMUC_003558 [Wickerhamomyces mucosus]